MVNSLKRLKVIHLVKQTWSQWIVKEGKCSAALAMIVFNANIAKQIWVNISYSPIFLRKFTFYHNAMIHFKYFQIRL